MCRYRSGSVCVSLDMSLFQSALDFLAAAGAGSAGSAGAASRDQHDFVGQIVELGDTKLRIRRVIAEGKHTVIQKLTL